ncbi:octopamine receptor beta-1R-like [Bolinopsis microptera]|uniref:octopamine receptor beta-1R-like n=1 Tax=Bolinopsis microptera TaxID=2820187 RepID=UPI003078EB93
MVAPDYSNYSMFGVKSSEKRYLWCSWLVFVLISSLIGDAVILIASLKYKAIKLNRIIVLFIEQIAACDMFLSLLYLVFTLVPLISNRWVYGGTLCTLRVYLAYSVTTASLLLICAMVTCKLLLVRGTVRTRNLTVSQVHIVCAVIWGLALYLPITFLILGKDDVWFDYRIYTCNYKFSSDTWRRWLTMVTSITLGFIPNFVIVSATVMLVLHLRRARNTSRQCRGLIRSQGIITVVLTAVVYTISILPYTVYQFTEPFVEFNYTSSTTFHTLYYRLANCFLLFNLLTNFFICSLTVRSFRTFLLDRRHQITSYRPCSMTVRRSTCEGISNTLTTALETPV